LHDGRDRLLELNSFRPEAARKLVREIENQDDDPSLDNFMLSVFEIYGVPYEDIGFRTYRVGSAGVLVESFPGLPADGFTVTCDRDRALEREDIQFLTWDHPLVTGAIDLILSSEKGNSSFARLQEGAGTGLILEAVYVLECVSPPDLHVDRFLPPTPIRVLVNERGVELNSELKGIRKADGSRILVQPELSEGLLPRLMEKSQEIAEGRIASFIQDARKEMREQLDLEIKRLKDLKKVNRSVRSDEIRLLEDQRRELDENLKQSRLRLDAVRLIQKL
jgi:ATP-dependent helicase HepA